MKETYIAEKLEVELRTPILMEGLPGLGMVGRIATRYLAKELKAKKLAELYSPHFPYYVLVNKKGSVRLLHGDFLFAKVKAGAGDMIFLSGDRQAQTIEGQYDVAGAIIDFAQKYGVKMIMTIGGYRTEPRETPEVIAISTNAELLDRALKANAKVSPSGNPIVGTAGLLLGLAKLRNIDALCLLGETRGYMPDPKAAKSVLQVSQKLLGLEVDLSRLHEEIEESKRIIKRMREIEKQRETYAERMRKTEEERITYIS
ncbi:MAG: proteasome assembly chaperone family protein [Candidatus Bathyarchaeota archaeon]|nr:MAG: proteasome assembly chaperone family protein [Candidatus Bathyarchaeota archaeon]